MITVVIPSRNAQDTLPTTLQSVKVAAEGLEVEILVIEDVEGLGPSWARNRGIERASGEVIFFVDADDTVKPDFFRRPLSVLERTGADMCFFSYSNGPKLEEGVVEGNDAVRKRFLPAFFGYSNDDVRRWNSGGRLAQKKEPGQVWRCAYRKAFLDKANIRFDEAMTFYEDAAFLSFAVAFADRVAVIPDELYEYTPTPAGNLSSGSGSSRHWEYKFHALNSRKRLDALTGGEVWGYCEASCVFSAMEMLKLWRRAGLPLKEAAYDFRRYLSDPFVRKSLRAFPVSIRHPAVLTLVFVLRFLSRIFAVKP